MLDKIKKLKKEKEEAEVATQVVEEDEEKGSFLNKVVNVILVFAIVFAAMSTYISFVSTSGNGVPSILGVSPFSIQTESMYPTFKPGDLNVGYIDSV